MLAPTQRFMMSDTSCAMGDLSKKLDFTTATRASDIDHATPSTSYFSAVEEQIERSKAHWSTLTDHLGYTDEEEVAFEESNKKEFQVLQMHPTWGEFFVSFNGDGISTGFDGVFGELVVGKKFAEGGQVELYEAHIKWVHPKNAEICWDCGIDCVLKVFKEGILSKHVKSQFPQGLLQYHIESIENWMSSTAPRVLSRICRGVLLKDGRFAFLMRKQLFDLRTLIERNMKLKSGEDHGPFSKEETKFLMHGVAVGVDGLHNHDIDLKASNVLVYEHKSGWPRWGGIVANYECSIGVVGTNFFRTPEILQACKEQKVNERLEVFSRAAYVYSYGMTCYEILIGKLPFEDHPLSDSPSILIDLVINQHLCPKIPKHVED